MKLKLQNQPTNAIKQKKKKMNRGMNPIKKKLVLRTSVETYINLAQRKTYFLLCYTKSV
jgi:hypothetical protein